MRQLGANFEFLSKYLLWLTAQGFDTGGSDGRVGRDTMRAIQAYQRKVGMTPTDGYAGLALLARLRQGG